jgi:hypothetical protein
MLIKGQDDCCIVDLGAACLRERHGTEGSWIDSNGRPVAHYPAQGRAVEVMRDLWEAAKAGKSFYEIPAK